MRIDVLDSAGGSTAVLYAQGEVNVHRAFVNVNFVTEEGECYRVCLRGNGVEVMCPGGQVLSTDDLVPVGQAKK